MAEVNEQLFDATDRVLAREGPEGLTSRAVTNEAGCAKGVLHNHFGDFDHFLAAFVLDRIGHMAVDVGVLNSQVGTGSVVDNLTAAAVSLFGSGASAITSLIAARPTLLILLRAALSVGGSPFDEIESVLAAYLDGEKRTGRIVPTADTSMLAFTLFGSLHHLFFTQGSGAVDPERVHIIVEALISPHACAK